MKRIVLGIAVAAALAAPAFAQQSFAQQSLAQQSLPNGGSNTGNDPLLAICSGFLAQSGQGVSGDAAKLCSCLVRETKSQLTAQEMKSYAQAAQSGQAPPDAVMQKIMGIATTCLTQAK